MAISASTIKNYNKAVDEVFSRHITLIRGDLHMMKAPLSHADVNIYGRFLKLPELLADYMVSYGENYFDSIETIDNGVYQDHKGWGAQYLSASNF